MNRVERQVDRREARESRGKRHDFGRQNLGIACLVVASEI